MGGITKCSKPKSTTRPARNAAVSERGSKPDNRRRSPRNKSDLPPGTVPNATAISDDASGLAATVVSPVQDEVTEVAE